MRRRNLECPGPISDENQMEEMRRNEVSVLMASASKKLRETPI